MIAIDSAQFRGTNGSAVPSGTPFQVALILRNSSVLEQAYSIRVVYTAGDPITQGIEIARSTVNIPSASIGGSQTISIPAVVHAPEGTRGKVYVIAYPQCPKRRTSIMDCTNIVYPVGDLTMTRVAGQGGPLGVAYPNRTWMGQSLRGSPFAVGKETPVSGSKGDLSCGNVQIPFPMSSQEYSILLSEAKSGVTDARRGMIFPGQREDWSYCATTNVGTVTQERWWQEIYQAAYSAWNRSRSAAPPPPPPPPPVSAPAPAIVAPVCVCDPPNCFKPGDPKLSDAYKKHTDVCGNVIVDEWCPECSPPNCYKSGDPKLREAKLKHSGKCGTYTVDAWCDVNCPKDPKDPRLPSGLLNWIKDICGCIVPKVRELSPEEIEKLNKAKAEAKGGSVVIARRTVVIENKPAGTPTGFSMAIEQPSMYSIYAPNTANITAAGSSKSDRIVLTRDKPDPTIITPSKNITSVPKSIDARLRDPQNRHTILSTDTANPSVNLNVQSERFQTPVKLDDLGLGDPQHYHINLTEPSAGSTAAVNVTGRKVRGGYFSQRDDLPPAFSSRLYVPGVYTPELPAFKGERTDIYAPGSAPVKKRK